MAESACSLRNISVIASEYEEVGWLCIINVSPGLINL